MSIISLDGWMHFVLAMWRTKPDKRVGIRTDQICGLALEMSLGLPTSVCMLRNLLYRFGMKYLGAVALPRIA